MKYLIPALALCCQACLASEEPIDWLRLLNGRAAAHFYFSHPEPEASILERRHARDRLVRLVDRAQERIEVWAYGLDEPSVLAAFARAQDRGLPVDIIGDPDTDYGAARDRGLQVDPRERSGIQHVKLVLVDRRWLFAGTGNLTVSGFFHNNNAFFHFALERAAADAIARTLAHETDPDAAWETDAKGTSGPGPDASALALPFAGRIFVGPRQGRVIQARLLQAILNARRRIRFMIFSFTDPVLNAALLFQARRGVIVEGVYDDEFGRQLFDPESRAFELNEALGSELAALYLDGNTSQFEKRPGEFHGGHLHHKTIIVDDDLVLTGSYNWSASARDRNLESFFEFADRAVAARFLEEFARVRERALLQARPLFVPPPRTPDRPLLLARGQEYCPAATNSGTPGFTIFAGRGPYFRALRFVPLDAQETAAKTAEGLRLATDEFARPCRLPGEALHAAGLPLGDATLAGGRYEDQAMTEAVYEPGAFTYDFRQADGARHAEGLPCEDPRSCDALALTNIDPEDGWIWLAGLTAAARDEPTPPAAFERTATAIRFWSRAGFSDWQGLEPVAPGYYRFEPRTVPGDFIVFLRNAAGRTALACVQAGAALDATPTYFLRYFAAEQGRAPVCLHR